jgi:hypothetical protein
LGMPSRRRAPRFLPQFAAREAKQNGRCLDLARIQPEPSADSSCCRRTVSDKESGERFLGFTRARQKTGTGGGHATGLPAGFPSGAGTVGLRSSNADMCNPVTGQSPDSWDFGVQLESKSEPCPRAHENAAPIRGMSLILERPAIADMFGSRVRLAGQLTAGTPRWSGMRTKVGWKLCGGGIPSNFRAS